MADGVDGSSSPFHQGESEVQRRVGIAEKMHERGKISIRNEMRDQHREFFAGLEYVFVGSSDQTGWPTASVLFGARGFVSSPDPGRLRISARPKPYDLLAENLSIGANLGVLGIDLTNRRRNRVNGTVVTIDEHGFELTVTQSFGNCPQYIHTRDIRSTQNAANLFSPEVAETFESLNDKTKDFIGRSSTFFVASCARTGDGASFDCDVSHRGGKPGFIGVGENQITIPDFSGNLFFNTIGNFVLNPKAGLIFPDFATGDVLLLHGTIELLWEDRLISAVRGAERAWRLHVVRGRKIGAAAVPLVGEMVEYSPRVSSTGTWRDANQCSG
jgi:uncharacterized protein